MSLEKAKYYVETGGISNYDIFRKPTFYRRFEGVK